MSAQAILGQTGIQPGRRYTREEIVALLDQKRADELKLKGYVLRFEADGTVSIVHWTKADDFQSKMHEEWKLQKKVSGRKREGGMLSAPGRIYEMPEDQRKAFFEVKPIVKRTPQQRLDSLMKRWVEDCLKHGTVPGLDDPMIATILGMAFIAGKTQLTAEGVRAIAAHFLTEAEAKKKAADAKKIVTPPHGS